MIDGLDWLTTETLATWLVPAFVAAVVTLIIEIIFKPSIEVRKDRRVYRDQSRRSIAAAFYELAAAAEIVRTMSRVPAEGGRDILEEETQRLVELGREARSALVRAPADAPKSIAMIGTSALATCRAVAQQLMSSLSGVLRFAGDGTLEVLITPQIQEELSGAYEWAILTADFHGARPTQILRRARLLLRAREYDPTHGTLS